MNPEIKQLKEDFYGNHNGSSFEEVIAITCVNQLTNFLLIGITSLFPVLTDNNLKWFRYLTEYIIIIIPLIICITIFSDHIFLILFGIVFLSFIVIVLCFIRRQTKPIVFKELLDLQIPYKTRIPFLTNLMSTLMLYVCIAILAVDFNLFPRRFAKTEIYGWSLMDVGVGSFIVANGGFAPESRLGADPKYKPMFLFRKTLFSTLPLILLGLQRLIAVKSLDYYEHITEYGLHWNFFFTLAFTKLFSTTFCCLFSNKVNIGFCGIVLMILHQICLNLGFSQFIKNDDRSGLIAANKEGIISLIGYTSLYLISVQIGKYIIEKRYQMKEWFKISFNLFSLSLISCLLMILSHNFIENVSRREVNLSFILWMISLNSIFMGLEFLIQTFVHIFQYLNVFGSTHSHSNSIIFSSIGYNGMLLFLVSNLLTGFVNFTIDTISASDLTAFIVLIGYSVVLSIVSVFCYKHKIQFKIPIKQKTE